MIGRHFPNMSSTDSPSSLSRILPINRIRPAALGTLRVLPPLGKDRARMATGTDHVRLAHDAPRARPLGADFDVTPFDPNFDVMHIEHDVVLLRIFDDAIPRPAPQPLAFRPIAATARPANVSHASPAREPGSRLAEPRDMSCPRM